MHQLILGEGAMKFIWGRNIYVLQFFNKPMQGESDVGEGRVMLEGRTIFSENSIPPRESTRVSVIRVIASDGFREVNETPPPPPLFIQQNIRDHTHFSKFLSCSNGLVPDQSFWIHQRSQNLFFVHLDLYSRIFIFISLFHGLPLVRSFV